MVLSRRTDDREIILKNQQKVFFQISGAGHEALLVAAGLSLRAGYDWFFPYYRDRALSLALGTTVEEQLLQAVGAASDVASGGRQMPSHWSDPKLHIVSASSSTATQCLQAVGCAEASLYLTQHPEAAKPGDPANADYRQFHAVDFHGDEVVYVSIGEGATSQGEFWESISIASNRKLPRPLRRRRQRLRHLRPGRSQHARRQHLAPARRVPQFPFRGSRRHRPGRLHEGLRGRRRPLPRPQRTRAGPRPRHPPLRALLLRRRAPLSP